MNIAIVGFGAEGRATYDFFAGQGGHTLTICDNNTSVEVPAGAQGALGEAYLDNLDRFDLIVRSAGIKPGLILGKNPGVAGKMTTHVEEFFKACPTRNIIGVTGTKGKGTTSTLITNMLEANGQQVRLGGNIGVPPLTFLGELAPESWVVLELSSFQLIDLHHSPHIAVCLMVVPEHLDWHSSLNEYLDAKEHLFVHQTVDDLAIYNAENEASYRIASAGMGQTVPFMTPPGAAVQHDVITIDDQGIIAVGDLKLLGKHNWQNACAAVTAVWRAGFTDPEPLRKVLSEFSGLEHRLEFVRELNGVRYYDDSFGTTPETAMVAIEAFAQPKILILGGSDKGASYDELAATVADTTVRQVLLIGDQAERIRLALEAAGFTDYNPGGNSMGEIVQNARQLAQPGDVVLLSTGCASFGMFHNYKDRGDQFKQAVSALV